MRNDIENLLKKNKFITLGFKKSYLNLERYLKDDEEVLYICNSNVLFNSTEEMKVNITSSKGKKPVVFAITDKRIVMYFKILGTEEFKQVPGKEIREYRFKHMKGFGSVLRIIALTQSFDLDLNWKKETIETVTSVLENLIHKDNVTKNSISESNSNDSIEKIRNLAKLRDDGIISDLEFENKKAELMLKI